jgi:hypothetical protein
MPDAISSLYSASPLFTMLLCSHLLDNVRALSGLSGSFYFYEPRQEIVRSSDYCSPIEWRQPSPNEAESLSLGELSSYSLELCRGLGSSVTKLSPEEAILLLCCLLYTSDAADDVYQV